MTDNMHDIGYKHIATVRDHLEATQNTLVVSGGSVLSKSNE